MNWAVVSDLDETLLTRDACEWEEARPALEELRRRRIPLVFCTSKTREETAWFQDRMGVRGPCIVENGGGIYWDSNRVALGTSYDSILAGLVRLKASFPRIRGFSDMSPEEISALTGLALELAERAKRREFDEPITVPADQAEVIAASGPNFVKSLGLKISRGGRFFHIHGDNDKGRAVRELKRLLGGPRIMALGDSPQDLPMLQVADVAVAVQKSDGRFEPALLQIPGIRRTGPAPGGWSRAVLEFLSEDKS
jgi:mannosyl-3-phosphoglycerate phosphatase